ncbi:MAG: carboxymuconolactone decarboxylase family protein [Bacteroidetes bacterium]|nr:carboxymuconolactone decarboxylase family protein [Bacteroidota bacterium]
MNNRIRIDKVEPEAYRSIYPLEKYLSASKISLTHKNLIKIRASQINGCAYCINMHTKEARAAGETEQRIYLLNAWRETDLFTEEEKAILSLTEEITLITNKVKDETYNHAAALFDEHYLAAIIMTVCAINVWNRIAISTQMQPE